MCSTTCYKIVGVGHSGEIRQHLVFEEIIHNTRRTFCSCAADHVAGRSKLQFVNVLLQWYVQDPDRVDEAKIRPLIDLGVFHFSCCFLGRKREEWMHGSCLVMSTLRNFHHNTDLLRWTHVLLSQPVKGDKMSGRQQINSFRNPLQVLFTTVLDYPVLQTSFPWLGSNLQCSHPFLGGGLLSHLSWWYQGQPGVHVKKSMSQALMQTLSCSQGSGPGYLLTHPPVCVQELWQGFVYSAFPSCKGTKVSFAVVCKLLWKWRVIMLSFWELSQMLGFGSNHSAPVISRNQDVYLSKWLQCVSGIWRWFFLFAGKIIKKKIKIVNLCFPNYQNVVSLQQIFLTAWNKADMSRPSAI